MKWFRFINIMYWLGLTMWLAAAASAGVAAAGVFATLPKLGLKFEHYDSALGNDFHQHGRVAGGMVMEPIFAASDLVQIVATVAVLLTLILQFALFKMRLRSPANVLRGLCIASATMLLAIHVVGFAPRMNHNLRQYWRAIESNDQPAMTTHRDAFESDHVIANQLYRLRFLTVILAIASSAVAFTSTNLTLHRKPSASTPS